MKMKPGRWALGLAVGAGLLGAILYVNKWRPQRLEARGYPSQLSVSPDGRWLAINKEALRLYNLEDGRRRILPKYLWPLQFSPDSRTYACKIIRNAEISLEINLYETESGRFLKCLTIPFSKTGGSTRFQFSSDGRAFWIPTPQGLLT